MKCKICGNVNPIGSLFCENCGQRMSSEDFCGHCGKKVAGTENFCPHCGKSLSGNSVPVREIGEKLKRGLDDAVEKLNSSNKKISNQLGDVKKTILLTVCNVVMGLLMLAKWVKSEDLETLGSFVGGVSSSATLFSLSKLLSDLGDFISSEALSAIGVLVITVTVATLLLFAFSLFNLFTKEENKAIRCLRYGCILSVIIVIFILICVIYINADIKEASYGIVSNSVSLTASPIIVALFGVFLLFFGLKKIETMQEN